VQTRENRVFHSGFTSFTCIVITVPILLSFSLGQKPNAFEPANHVSLYTQKMHSQTNHKSAGIPCLICER